MKRLFRAALVVGLVAAFSGHAGADDTPVPKTIVMTGTPEEIEAWKAVEEDKYVRARALGEAIIKAHPDSFAGHFVLAVAFHLGESDLPRSARHLELARTLYATQHPAPAKASDPWRWQALILGELASTYQEMERFEPMLGVIAELDGEYKPARPGRHIWPLIKLRRYDEARRFITLALQSKDAKERQYALSGLCNLESESGTRMAAYTACLDVTTSAKAKEEPNMVELSNAGEASIATLRFEEGERLYVRSTKGTQSGAASPYQRLADLYLSQGRVAEAVAAMRGAREQQIHSDPWLDQQKAGLLDGTLADLLLAAGEADRAVQIAERAVTRPDRHGLWSGTPEQAHAAEALRFAAALHVRAEELEEEASVAGFRDATRLYARAAMDRLEVWRQRRRAGVLLSAENFFIQSWRPYAPGRIDFLPWMVPEMIGAAGGGVSLAAIARAREPDGWGHAYLDAYEAEAHLACGDTRAAFAAAERAIRDLPQAEVLLRARASAISALAARQNHDLATETARLSQVLAHDPSLFRRLGMTLPITVKSDGSEVAEKAKRLVSGSPRFRAGAGGFVVTLSGGGAPQACLLGPSGERIQCARPKLPDSAAVERARGLVRELHKVAFALSISLSQTDLNSLDGSPASARAARQVDQLLGGMAP